MRDTASKKILVEVSLLKAIEARNALPIDAVLKQLNQLRGQSGAGVSPASSGAREGRDVREGNISAQHSPPSHAAREISAPQEAPAVYAGLSELWAKLIDAVGKVSPFIRSYLREAGPVSFEKSVFTIGFDPEFTDHLGMIDNPRNHTMLQTKLAELGHPNCQIKFVKADAPIRRDSVGVQASTGPSETPMRELQRADPKTGTPATTAAKEKSPVTFNKNDFKNDPLIQKALEIFKGQIVDVRA